jgi:ABC-type dipeptide/oligopeptide/nickel transport system permease subunit
MTLGIGLAGAAVAVVVGVALGALAGYAGGWADAPVMRVVDFARAFPSLFVILLLSAVFSTGLVQLILLIGAQDYLWTAPWLAVAPGLAITATMLAIYRLGDRQHAARFRLNPGRPSHRTGR